jgi:uroporphyrinogen-III synthase
MKHHVWVTQNIAPFVIPGVHGWYQPCFLTQPIVHTSTQLIYDVGIITSPHAAHGMYSHPAKRYDAVGTSSAQCAGLSPVNGYGSEAVLRRLSKRPFLRIIVYQSNHPSRLMLQKTLMAWGHRVDNLACYSRISQSFSRSAWSIFYQQHQRVILISSLMAWRYLYDAIGHTVCSVPVVVSSQRIAYQLYHDGVHTVWVANTPIAFNMIHYYLNLS